MLITLSLSILVVMELHKLWWHRRHGGSAPRAALTAGT
jgi:hypothetical protein